MSRSFALLKVAAATLGVVHAAGAWRRVLLTDAVRYGAMCLDGSPAAYYVRPGVGENATKFVIFWEGGGWCVSLEDCAGRALTALGSSVNYPPTTNGYDNRDLLNPDCSNNYNFCNWTHVYEPYCDGTSRSGDALEATPIDPPYRNISQVYFRGWKNMEATIRQLLSADPAPRVPGMPSLLNATHVLISGSSAGGLTTYLHADYITAEVHQQQAAAGLAAAVVKAVPEVGFFIDGDSIWGEHIYTGVYARVAAFANVTTGSPVQANAACMEANNDPRPYPTGNRWKCFMAQYTYPYISTPVFILNSQVDEWQTSNILAPSLNTTFDVTTYPPFAPCIKDPAHGCNATQFTQWSNYAGQFMGALKAAQAATPASQLAANGGFITTCAIHTTAISGYSYKIKIGGVTMYDALSQWYFDAPGAVAWRYDVPWPGNPTCPGPLERAAAARVDEW